MAIVMIEGWDHWDPTQVQKGWSAGSGGVTQVGRFGGQAARSGTTTKTHQLPSSYATIFVGFALRMSVIGSATDFFFIRASATNILRVSQDATGHLVIKNSGGTTIATGGTVLVANGWTYIEIKLFINGASGTVEVHQNGSTDIASTVGNFGSSNADNVGYAGITAQTTDFDDLYVADTSGSAPRNTFLGDVRVATIYPTGAGNSTQWTPNGAASNWDCVDEVPPDSDTTYVSDSTPGHIDSYACSDIDGGATVYGVQTNLFARKDDAGTRQVAPLIRQSGTDYAGTTVTLASTYAFFSQLYNQDPTAADWTPTTVNGDEFGVKEIA